MGTGTRSVLSKGGEGRRYTFGHVSYLGCGLMERVVGNTDPVKFFCLFFQRRLGSHGREVEWLFWYRGDMYP